MITTNLMSSDAVTALHPTEHVGDSGWSGSMRGRGTLVSKPHQVTLHLASQQLVQHITR